MLPFAFKPLDQVTPDDLMHLISEQVQEGSTIEFKERLPTKDGSDDPWMSGVDRIGDRARNEILEEVVAFANAHGGYIFLGIEESREKPPRAVAIKPLPRCAILAEKLRLQARDCIEPQLPVFSTAGVVTDGDGGGVIIVRVEPSRLAPHRLKPTLECYYRRADRSEKMSMREIQDLTLFRERGMAQVNAVFDARRQSFYKWVNSVDEFMCAFRVDVVPTSKEIYVPDIMSGENYIHMHRQFSASFSGTNNSIFPLHLPYCTEERSIVRGIRRSGDTGNWRVSHEIMFDGSISTQYSIKNNNSDQYPRIFISWFLSIIANALKCADIMRCRGGLPDLEYILEMEFIPSPRGIYLGWVFDDYYNVGKITEVMEFPRISVGSRDEFNHVMTMAMNDLRALAGAQAFPHPIQVEFGF